MAERSTLSLLAQARANDAAAQLALGRLYLCRGASPSAAGVWLDRAARQGDAEALSLLGARIPAAAVPDPHAAAPLYERAAAAGATEAMRVLADWTLAGRNVGLSLGRATSLLATAAGKGDVGAQLRLARCLEFGEGCEPDLDAALHWYAQAAANGSRAAREILAQWYWRLGHREALALLEQCATQGSPAAAAGLGLLLVRNGRPREAVPWLERAADCSIVEACLALGRLHATKGGRGINGVTHHYKAAIALFERAARAGAPEGWFELSRVYALRSCAVRNAHTAQRCLQRAAELGHPEAQYRCGVARLRRRGVDDQVAAAAWLMPAAAAGHVDAQRLLRARWPGASPPSPALARQRAMVIASIASVDLDLARRLELGEALGLDAPAAVHVDPHRADRGHCFVVPVLEKVQRHRLRVVLLDGDGKRGAVGRARRLIEPDPPCASDLPKARIHRLVVHLESLRCPREIFDWPLRTGSSGVSPSPRSAVPPSPRAEASGAGPAGRMGALRALLAALALVLAVLPPSAPLAQWSAPGDAPYTPTRLEWAVLELQARYGEATPQPERPILVAFVARSDGVTVLCLIQHHPSYPEEALSFLKRGIAREFDRYRAERGWPWLQLEFREIPL